MELSGKTRGGNEGIYFYVNEDKEHGATTSRLLCSLYWGDFNRANLSYELAKVQTAHQVSHQGHKHPGPLLHNFKGRLSRSVPRAALGVSDHSLVHLILTYRQKLKSAKPVVKTVTRWTTEAKLELQAILHQFL
ncbi:hypothetical protein L3Q82_022811 [Scortum barcoo]|uniref:Uncharacterized protein n=1 Tax=Scortum barcoo TaxID=214431 RepID=A0ACB8WX11_9TELE|nr:hypothetical protein L3Q82_022811 [Scortum barcoo]